MIFHGGTPIIYTLSEPFGASDWWPCKQDLKDKVDSDIPDDVFGVMEIVIDGVDEDSVKEAMKQGIEAACNVDGVLQISAGNFGGNLGAYKINLQDLF